MPEITPARSSLLPETFYAAFLTAFIFCLALALALTFWVLALAVLVDLTAGLATGAELGVCAEAEVEITDKGRARTAALARIDRNFFMDDSDRC